LRNTTGSTILTKNCTETVKYTATGAKPTGKQIAANTPPQKKHTHLASFLGGGVDIAIGNNFPVFLKCSSIFTTENLWVVLLKSRIVNPRDWKISTPMTIYDGQLEQAIKTRSNSRGFNLSHP